MKRKGFTLIELLLGMVIFSIVSLTVYSVFWGGINLSRRAEAQGKFFRDVRLSLELMSREIENMRPFDFSNSYPDRSAFIGEKDKITFISATKDGLKVVRYYLLPPEAGKIHRVTIGRRHEGNKNIVANVTSSSGAINYLVRDEMDFIDYLNSDSSKPGNIEILIPNVKGDGLSFSFGYFQGEDRATVQWKDAWSEATIPRMVNIKLDVISDEKNQESILIEKDVFIPHGALNESKNQQ